MLDDFLVRAALARIGHGGAGGFAGVFRRVWRRMAYFGEPRPMLPFWAWPCRSWPRYRCRLGVLAVAVAMALTIQALPAAALEWTRIWG